MKRTGFLPVLATLWLAASAALADSPGAPTLTSATRSQCHFRPGRVWLDSSGQPINAHGGGMLFHAGTYYWYGEDKQGRTWMPATNRAWDGYRVDVTGIRCYSSTTLYDWRNEGLVLKANPADPSSDLHPSRVLERPKVAFNNRTHQFVMWVHIDTLDYQTARAGVAVADSPTGPFRYLGSVKPEGGDSRDQTLFVDDDGNAYRVYSSEWNKTTCISLLSEDWLQHVGKYVTLFKGQSLEAHSLFKRGSKYYLLASGCSGWDPNPAHAAVADSIWGPWVDLGNPCVGKNADTTFRSQGTFVFQVQGRQDAFIFMADRWNKRDLPASRYVWLPIHFQDLQPRLDWMKQWDLSFFDNHPTQPLPARRESRPPPLRKPFSVQTQAGASWLTRPDGRRFFSLGVCCVDMGTPRERLSPTNPSYAAWQHYPSSNRWAQTTLRRLESWGFTTIGGWSDFHTLVQCTNLNLALTPVLHVGSTAGAPWWDMWDPKIVDRMEQVARDQILPLRDNPHLLGYYSDNEIGWWNAALLNMTLDQAPGSGQRQRLLALLHAHYHDDWGALNQDFEPEGAADWQALASGGKLHLRPGNHGLDVVRQFLALLAERYYALIRQIIHKYDPQALILGDRYQSFFFPEVARASSPYVDAMSSNLNAWWNDGSFPRFYLETLHSLTHKPILVSEFYMAAQRNRSGSRNRNAVFPVTDNQTRRAVGFATTLHALLGLPYVIGADWFQYYDEPPFGRFDGEDYNFGLVDIDDQPYSPLTRTASRFHLTELKSRNLAPRPNASSGVPPAPKDPLGQFKSGLALKRWDRERGFVPPHSESPLADLYVCWNRDTLFLGLCAQDVAETSFYRDKSKLGIDRAEWSISINNISLRARLGAGLDPTVNNSAVRVINLSGVDLNTRNIAAIELPARLLGRDRFRAGDTILLSSTFLTHCRAYRTEWKGRFRLRSSGLPD